MKKKFFLGLAAIAAGLCLTACEGKQTGNVESADSLTLSGLNPVDFVSDSTALYVISNQNGMEVCFTNFGGRIVSIMVPDKDGNMTDVCLGHDNIADYEKYGAEGCNFAMATASQRVSSHLTARAISSPLTTVPTACTAVAPSLSTTASGLLSLSTTAASHSAQAALMARTAIPATSMSS